MGFQFPDAAMSGKPMKASYINDLRSKINVARSQQGQPPINWGPDLQGGSNPDVIRASHIKDIRDAIRNLWLTKDLIDQPSEFPGFANGEPNNLTALFASQTGDPRLWLNQSQDAPTKQGISSLITNQATNPDSKITTSWVNDLKSLEPNENKRLRAVRCLLYKRNNGISSIRDGRAGVRGPWAESCSGEGSANGSKWAERQGCQRWRVDVS